MAKLYQQRVLQQLQNFPLLAALLCHAVSVCERIDVAWRYQEANVAHSFSPAHIEYLRRQAKKLGRANGISHNEAIDQIAQANGYSTWALMMKHHPEKNAKGAHPPFQFSRTLEQMRIALRKVAEPDGWPRIRRSEVAQQQVEDLSKNFVSPQNAVEFAIDYMTCLLKVPHFKVYTESPVYWEMRLWLPYFCHPVEEDETYILVNRHYKPVGQVNRDWADYEAFQSLHAEFSEDLRSSFTAMNSNVGYLFNDGCPPWESRKYAVAYLKRLHILRQALEELKIASRF